MFQYQRNSHLLVLKEKKIDPLILEEEEKGGGGAGGGFFSLPECTDSHG